MKIWLQWAGVGLAAIPSGIVLALLLQKGFPQLEARGIAIALGAFLAVVFWNLIGRKFAVPEQAELKTRHEMSSELIPEEYRERHQELLKRTHQFTHFRAINPPVAQPIESKEQNG